MRCSPQLREPGSYASFSSNSSSSARISGSSTSTCGRTPAADALDDLAVRREQLLELLPEVHPHREVAVALVFGEEAGAGDLERLRRPVAPGELDDDRREVDHRTGEPHHADEEVAARPGDARELRDRPLRAVDDVAQRPPEADRHVERVVREAREVGDVADHRLDVGHAGAQQLELPGRDVERGDVGAEPEHLEREPARAGAGVEHPVAGADVALERPGCAS